MQQQTEAVASSECARVVLTDSPLKRMLGRDHHPFTLIAVNNLATLLDDQGKLRDAELLYRRALEGTE